MTLKFPGALSKAAYERHPAKYWALETIQTYAQWLAPRMGLEQGDDLALARLIDETYAPPPPGMMYCSKFMYDAMQKLSARRSLRRVVA